MNTILEQIQTAILQSVMNKKSITSSMYLLVDEMLTVNSAK